MSDVYRKDGVPDRLVDTEAERVAAVWEGFKKVEAEKKAEKTDTKPDSTKPAANRNQS